MTIRPVIATWYDVSCQWNMVFEPVKVVAFTDKTVTVLRFAFDGKVREDRWAIVSEYHHFYRTFDEAKSALISACQRKIDAARKELEDWSAYMEKAQAITI